MAILIERECGLKLTVRGVGDYLKRWGMTPQKPIKRAYEQKPEAVKTWIEENKAKIEAFYLPSDSPQLNPDERLNADLNFRGRRTFVIADPGACQDSSQIES